MKPDDEVNELVDALRADLPTAEQAARVRARLVAIGVVGAQGLCASSAGAAVGASSSAVSLASIPARFAALSWGTKLGLAAAVSVSAVTGPIWLSSASRPVAPAAKPSPKAKPVSSVRTQYAAPARGARPASRLAPVQSVEIDRLAPGQPEPAPAAVWQQTAHLPVSPTLEAESAASVPRIRAVAAEPNPASSGAPVVVVSSARTPSRVAPQIAAGAAQADSAIAASSEPTADTRAATAAFPAPMPAAKSPTPSTTLREETVLIDGAFAALRRGDRAGAAELVAQHERRFPNGLLRKERERARTKLEESAAASE